MDFRARAIGRFSSASRRIWRGTHVLAPWHLAALDVQDNFKRDDAASRDTRPPQTQVCSSPADHFSNQPLHGTTDPCQSPECQAPDNY